MYRISVYILIATILAGCTRSAQQTITTCTIPRFFNDSSIWNTPIPEDAKTDVRSSYWIELLKTDPSGEAGFGINTTHFTIPVYEACDTTPVYKVNFRMMTDDQIKACVPNRGDAAYILKNRHYGHGPGFDSVPIPWCAMPDPGTDGHMAIVDRKRGIAWDMMGAQKNEKGEWCSHTGMTYLLNGPGTFPHEVFPATDGQSIYFYGPSRPSGMPIIGGLIRYEEIMAGEINHKIACATRYNALKEFVAPAIWTDGDFEGGIPEGAILQLDPKLDLTPFNLTPAETLVARAMQKYGLVLVDWAGGNVIYAEGLYASKDKSWDNKLRGWKDGIVKIPLEHYRVLKVGETVKMGDHKKK